MDAKDFVNIFLSRRQLFGGIVAFALLVGIVVYRFQEPWYQGELLLSVTRTSGEDTAEYRYDHFYRLQADERMADTIARYLESETGKRDIANETHSDSATDKIFHRSSLQAIRLSSSLLQISFADRSLTEAERTARAITEVADRYVQGLNETAKEKAWFAIVAADPFIDDGRFSLGRALLAGFFGGLFIAFWAALAQYYWKEKKDKAE